jgi:hypothetical protein
MESNLLNPNEDLRSYIQDHKKHAQIQQLKKIKGSLPKKHTDKAPEGTWQATPINDTLDQGEHTDGEGLARGDSKRHSKLGSGKEISHGDSIVQGTSNTDNGQVSQVGERMAVSGDHGSSLGAAYQGTLSRRNAEVLRSYTEKIKKINDDLGDARGCTEHKHQ